jgi:hypothetical protein
MKHLGIILVSHANNGNQILEKSGANMGLFGIKRKGLIGTIL